MKLTADLRLIAEQDVKLIRVGKAWRCCCLFHRERTPSLYVWHDHYHCFGCGAHGDTIEWLKAVRRLTFRQAVECLGSDLDSSRCTGRNRQKQELRPVDPKAA